MPKNEITRIMSTNSHERTCAPLRLHPRNFTQPHSTAYYTKLGCSVAQYSPPFLTLATLNPSNRQKPRHVALRSRVASGAAHRPPRKQTRHWRLVAHPAGRRFVCVYRLDKVPNSIILSGGISTGRHIRHRFLAHMHGRSAPSVPLNFHSKSECEADYSPSMKDPV